MATAPSAPAPVPVERKQWLPLESNPDLMNKYMHALGVSPQWAFYDVFGTDPALLEMVPRPVIAVLLLYPITANSEAHRAEEENEKRSKQDPEREKSVFWMKQTVGNACGTVGLLHAILNNRDHIELDETKFFAKFERQTKEANVDERAGALEASDDIEVEHQALAQEATSDVDHVVNANLHFAAFVPRHGSLWEFDGRKGGPVDHGATTAETFFEDSIKVIEQFMSRDPDDIRFNMVALAPAGAE